ncbi:olfactory receptor 10A7-like [Microcaecilia unicolor]|uniref:Olfactory receptor 10A7-like n=1 Tax=Microcaecilia unicolor TaxID=1415580 RepID=A0A6P7WQ31_9AMPH|nr:olfactory receptor 10A7-like [Microcaecilia unicolor]
MASENQSVVSGFILLGFSDLSAQVQRFLFVLLLLCYMLAMTGNLLVFTILTVDPALQKPMYFFLRNLSIIEIFIATSIIPRTLVNLLSEDRNISFLGCILQMYFAFFFGSEECMLLGIMAFDRYVAICKPLHYSTIMSNRNCVSMAVSSWIISVGLQFGQMTFVITLPFCGSKVIHHFFCDFPAVLKLACTNTYFNDVIRIAIAVFFLVLPFLITLSSYIYILSTVLRMVSRAGRSKAFSTCSSHLAAVTLFYGTTMLTYLQPATDSAHLRVFAVLYCLINPMLNPLIFSLRNNEVKGAFRRRIWGKITFLCKL